MYIINNNILKFLKLIINYSTYLSNIQVFEKLFCYYLRFRYINLSNLDPYVDSNCPIQGPGNGNDYYDIACSLGVECTALL